MNDHHSAEPQPVRSGASRGSRSRVLLLGSALAAGALALGAALPASAATGPVGSRPEQAVTASSDDASDADALTVTPSAIYSAIDAGGNDTWNTGARRTVGAGKTIITEYECADYNKIQTPDGPDTAYPYLDAGPSYGWTNNSGSGVSAIESANSKDTTTGTVPRGDDYMFTNWSTSDKPAGVVFRCALHDAWAPSSATGIKVAPPTQVSSTAVTLNAAPTAKPNALDSSVTSLQPSQYWVEYGSAPGDYSHKSAVNTTKYAADGQPSMSVRLTDLQPGVTYHYRFAIKMTYYGFTPGDAAHLYFTDYGAYYSAPNNYVAIPSVPTLFSKAGTTEPQYLEVNSAATADQSPIDVWPLATGSDGQAVHNEQWIRQASSKPGYDYLIDRNSGKCLGFNGTDSSVGLWKCVVDTPNQLWKQTSDGKGHTLLQVELADAGSWKAGTYYLSTKDDPANVGSGGALTLLSTPDARSTWLTTAPLVVQKTGASGQYLQVDAAGRANGVSVSTWAEVRDSDGARAANETWSWIPGSGGSGTLVSLESGKCFEVNGNSGAIDQWDCTTGAPNQKWTRSVDSAGNETFKVTLAAQSGPWAAGTYYLSSSVDPGSVGNGAKLTLQTSADSRSLWTVSDGQ